MSSIDQKYMYEHAGRNPPLESLKIRKVRKIIATLPKRKRMKVLDVGCNDGFYARLFPGYDYHGVDIIKVSADNHLAKRIVSADLSKGFPFKDNEFSVVFASEILEYVFDTDFFVRECSRVFKSGGTLIMTTPNSVPLYSRVRCLLLGSRPYSADARAIVGKTPGHIRLFVKKDIQDIFTDNSFRIDILLGEDMPFVPLGSRIATIAPTLSTGFIIRAINMKR
jgi:SAM-dependent methyltransferase